jgi:V/A-type H+-transporting ATPase subunit I
MPWADTLEPVRMARVAVVAPTSRLAVVLGALGRSGAVQLDVGGEPELAPDAAPEQVAEQAVVHGEVAGLVGWTPLATLGGLQERLGELGGGVVELAVPRGVDPPTLVTGGATTRAFQPLVDTYATVPYRDVNPAVLAGLAYVVMFGMMFGDAGHGLLLVGAGLLVRSGRPSWTRRIRHLWPFVVGAGAASVGFGFAYGEFFGPTKVVPVLWLAPLDHPTTLLATAVLAGGGLLAVSYVIGSVNRWREGGIGRALVALSGIAGTALYAGVAAIGLGWYRHTLALELVGAAMALTGLGLGGAGLYATSSRRGSGVVEVGTELFDAVVRVGTNTVSFARLAAFGLTHAALCGVVLTASDALWHRGLPWLVPCAVVFVAGNAVAFGLEGLVAGVQALRLEYYELFSRIFVAEGDAFRPWHITTDSQEEPCSPG